MPHSEAPSPTGEKADSMADSMAGAMGDAVVDETVAPALEDAGATAATCVIASRSAAHCCEQLGALADLTNLLTTEAR